MGVLWEPSSRRETIIIKAKADLGVSFTQLEEALVTLGFKRTVLSNLCKIASNPVLRLPGKSVPTCPAPTIHSTS